MRQPIRLLERSLERERESASPLNNKMEIHFCGRHSAGDYVGSRLGPNAIASWKHPDNVLDRGLVSEKGQGRVGPRGSGSSGIFVCVGGGE